ncbi:MAG: hypothetical protein GY778_10460, partial [bacterium]|nr:hypothetical protein [bacterium]
MGVPFSRGELLPGTPVRIVDPGGTPTDGQFRPMALFDDGSVRWLACDFQADVPASGSTTYGLELNASHATSTGLTVSETAGAITVTTGPLKFEVSKTACTLFHRVWLDLNGNGLFGGGEEIVSPGFADAGPVVVQGGITYRANAAAPTEIEIEEQGPMKVV